MRTMLALGLPLSIFAGEIKPDADKIVRFEADYYGVWKETPSTGNYRYAPGFRALMEINFDRDNSLEFIYFGLLQWNRRDAQSGISSGELSYWRHLSPRFVDDFSISWMIGGRYINLYDRDLSYNLRNNMWGGQLGFSFDVFPVQLLSLGFQFKGGAYGNGIAAPGGVDRSRVAWTLEWMPYIRFSFNPFYLIVAYDGTMIFNAAFASIQRDPNTILTYKHDLYNALYVGMGFSW